MKFVRLAVLGTYWKTNPLGEGELVVQQPVTSSGRISVDSRVLASFSKPGDMNRHIVSDSCRRIVIHFVKHEESASEVISFHAVYRVLVSDTRHW